MTARIFGRAAFVDETGNVHGTWRVLGRGPNDYQSRATWLCQCEACGAERVIAGTVMRSHPPRCACTPGRGGSPPRRQPAAREPEWRKDATGSVPDHLRAVLGD